MKFFYPDGREIEGDQNVAVEKFRSFYSSVYHYENWDAAIPERLIQGILSSRGFDFEVEDGNQCVRRRDRNPESSAPYRHTGRLQ